MAWLSKTQQFGSEEVSILTGKSGGFGRMIVLDYLQRIRPDEFQS